LRIPVSGIAGIAGRGESGGYGATACGKASVFSSAFFWFSLKSSALNFAEDFRSK
jgi:hypothetical protein